MMNWETFLNKIAAGKIILVIGDNLSLVKDEKGIPTPLYLYLARELSRKLNIPYPVLDSARGLQPGRTHRQSDLQFPER